MCTESLLGVSEAQAVPGRVRAPGTVQTARQVALHRVTGGSLPRRRRLFSEGSRDAAPGRASEARSLSVRFPPPWQPCSPGLPEVRLRLLGQRDRELCFPPGWCCSALWEVPQSGGPGRGGCRDHSAAGPVFQHPTTIVSFFPCWFSTGKPRPQHFEGGRKFPRPL